MPDPHTLAETEAAMNARIDALPLDFAAAHAVSSLYRAANAVRGHLTNTVLRRYELTWTGFVVLWVVWVWDGMETRHVAESAAISKATLTGVVKTLEGRGLMTRESPESDRRLVQLRLTSSGRELMAELYPQFNAVEAEVVRPLSEQAKSMLTRDLRLIVRSLEQVGAPEQAGAPQQAGAADQTGTAEPAESVQAVGGTPAGEEHPAAGVHDRAGGEKRVSRRRSTSS